jgi:hypothetical protein
MKLLIRATSVADQAPDEPRQCAAIDLTPDRARYFLRLLGSVEAMARASGALGAEVDHLALNCPFVFWAAPRSVADKLGYSVDRLNLLGQDGNTWIRELPADYPHIGAHHDFQGVSVYMRVYKTGVSFSCNASHQGGWLEVESMIVSKDLLTRIAESAPVAAGAA